MKESSLSRRMMINEEVVVKESFLLHTLKVKAMQTKVQMAIGLIFCLISLVTFLHLQQTHSTPGIKGWNVVQGNVSKQTTKSAVTQKVMTSSKTASDALIRVSQLDPAQYNTVQDYNTWWPSACSAASMTEVMNAYGHHYRIADIVAYESSIHEITPDLGLLESAGIDHTVAHFGFKTRWMVNPTIQDVIDSGNAGTPVIIGFPPAKWSGGHLLVVRGGNSQSVFLADSSRLNMQVMARTTFDTYWGYTGAIVTPA